LRRVDLHGSPLTRKAAERPAERKSAPEGAHEVGVENEETVQRTVESLLAEAVIGLTALTTGDVASIPANPLMLPSARRAATPMPATTVANTSDSTTIFTWVMRSAD